ncbi:interleukin-17D [Piliocolobus tephrosceles]|uniref:interleukin-17D n=1 Tax=Piliocolobus tephrosceles TaxID=591936 RepID=UPI000E6B2281|nr:interleukin-17D [Piliocolobus tephrosceles]
MLVAGFLLALPPGWAAGAPRAGRRPARPRGCADRPEELLEQLYGRLAAGVLSAFHHTLQLGPREQARNASCPAGGRPADRRFRPPTNLRSVSPWAYSISYAIRISRTPNLRQVGWVHKALARDPSVMWTVLCTGGPGRCCWVCAVLSTYFLSAPVVQRPLAWSPGKRPLSASRLVASGRSGDDWEGNHTTRQGME